MWIKFHYKKYAPGIIRPVIPVEITANEKKIRYEALIDSGSDLCIFDSQIADLLGLDLKQGKKSEVSGITGVLQPYYLFPVNISIGGWDYEIQAGFMPKMPELGYGVLGQVGFFENFQVKLDYPKAEIDLNPIIRN